MKEKLKLYLTRVLASVLILISIAFIGYAIVTVDGSIAKRLALLITGALLVALIYPCLLSLIVGDLYMTVRFHYYEERYREYKRRRQVIGWMKDDDNPKRVAYRKTVKNFCQLLAMYLAVASPIIIFIAGVAIKCTIGSNGDKDLGGAIMVAGAYAGAMIYTMLFKAYIELRTENRVR